MAENRLTYDIFTPISEGMTFRSSFVRKKKNKGNSTNYYLYSEDQQDLLLVATRTSQYKYVITQDALDISKNSEYFVGEVIGNRSNLTYKGLDNQCKEHISITLLKYKDKKASCPYRQVRVQIPGKYDILQRQPSYTNGVYTLNFPEVVIPSKKNFILDFNCNLCCSIGKIYEDEHFFIVNYPFSIFQGFCFALAGMKEFSKES